jgi:regulator of sigma E protease
VGNIANPKEFMRVTYEKKKILADNAVTGQGLPTYGTQVLIVFIHELGHFFAAKLTGMRVDRFSIGFPPRAFGKKIGETDYCISWIPFGGYVKIAGMVDESLDTDFLSHEPQPWEYRAKPIWARMLVISAGVIMNVILAISIFWGINYTHGRLIEETTEIGMVNAGSPAAHAGLQRGDVVVAVNGQAVTHWDEIQNAIYVENFGRDIVLTVRRSGSERQVQIPRSMLPDNADFGLTEAGTVVMIGEVTVGLPADKVGLKAGDILVSLNDVPVLTDSSVINIVRASAGKMLKVAWKRDSVLYSGIAVPTDSGRIGIRLGNYYAGPRKIIRYSLFEALGAGVRNARQSVEMFFKSIAQIIIGKSSIRDNFGGPIAIAKYATQSAESGITSFLGFLGLLSMSLAILNILPFPALDGGHLMMLVYEKIFRREIPHRVKIGIQKAGFILLVLFMIFVIYNDITRL